MAGMENIEVHSKVRPPTSRLPSLLPVLITASLTL